MAKKITSILFSGRYLAIHWRYNKRDFGKHCDTEKDWRACPIYKFGHSHPEKFAEFIIDMSGRVTKKLRYKMELVNDA